MAYGFGATYGTANTDVVLSTLATSVGARSWAVRLFRHGAGAGSGGRVWSRFVSSAKTSPLERFLWNASTSAFRVSRGYTNAGTWDWTTLGSLDTWYRVVITHDGTTAAPKLYLDGVLQTSSQIIAPTGSLSTGDQPYSWGNTDGGSGGALGWDGMLQECAIWDRTLSAAEAYAYGIGASPLLIPRPVSYLPMVHNGVDYLGGVTTVTGAVVQPHQSTQMPSGPSYAGILPITAVPVPAAFGVQSALTVFGPIVANVVAVPFSGKSTLTAAGAAVSAVGTAFSGKSTITASGRAVAVAAAPFSAKSTITASVGLGIPAAFSAKSTITASGRAVAVVPAAPAGKSTITVTPIVAKVVAPNFTVASQLTVFGPIVAVTRPAPFAGKSTMTASGRAVAVVSAAFSAKSTMTATQFGRTAFLAQSTITAAGRAVRVVSAAFGGHGVLSCAPVPAVVRAAPFTCASSLAAAGRSVCVASAAFAAASSLAASGIAVSCVSAAFSTAATITARPILVKVVRAGFVGRSTMRATPLPPSVQRMTWTELMGTFGS